MKKILMTALLAVAVTVSALAMGPVAANRAAVNNFKIEFKTASDVSWSATDNYVKASFILNNERMEAFYNLDGDKIGTSKAFNTEMLPIKAKRVLAKKFDGFTVKQSIEFKGTEENAYYISAENDWETVILKVNLRGDLSTIQRTSK